MADEAPDEGRSGLPEFDVRSALEDATDYYRARRLEEAVLECERIIEAQPANAYAHHLIGIIAAQNGDTETAFRMVSRAVELEKRNPAFHNSLANLLAEQGRMDEAVDAYRTAISLDPNYAVALSNLAAKLLSKGNSQEARKLIARALQSDYSCAEAHNAFGNLKVAENALDAAITSYRRAIALNPGLHDAHSNLGAALKLLGHMEDAESEFRAALSINPRLPLALNNLGVVLLEQRRFAEAVNCFNETLKLQPNFSEALVNMGRAHYALGDAQHALECFDAELSLSPNHSGGHADRAHVLFSLGYVDEAIAGFLRAIELRPSSEDAYSGLIFTLLRCGRFGELCEIVQGLQADGIVSRGELSRLTVVKALAQYQQGAFEACRLSLDEAKAMFESREERLNMRILETYIYHGYLNNLLGHLSAATKEPATQADGKFLHFIGDSHCLSPAWQTVHLNGEPYQVMPHLVMGGKAWHLSKPGINQYKQNLLQIWSRLPEGATVIVSFGEIDCRLQEGILRHAGKQPGTDLEQQILATVAPFVRDMLSLAGQKRGRLFFQGVPAPNVDFSEVLQEDRERLLFVIRFFNAALATLAGDAGAGFLDVYGLTAEAGGISNRKWHMDPYHLVPSYIQEFFA